MNDLDQFLRKVKNDIKGGVIVYITYDGVNFKSMRETSSKIESIKGAELVGVYDKQASESEIVEDCLCHLKSYQKKQKERDSLNKAMTSKKKAL